MTNALGLLVLVGLAQAGPGPAGDELPATGVRIRITGKESVEVTGLASIAPHSERFHGRVVSWDVDLVMVEDVTGQAPLALPHSGRRIIGQLVAAAEGTRSLRLDKGQRLIRIPRQAVAQLEVSRERRTRVESILRSSGIGLLIAGVVVAPAFAVGDDDCYSCGPVVKAVAVSSVGLGALVGAAVGANRSLDRWERVRPPAPPTVRIGLAPRTAAGIVIGVRVSF